MCAADSNDCPVTDMYISNNDSSEYDDARILLDGSGGAADLILLEYNR